MSAVLLAALLALAAAAEGPGDADDYEATRVLAIVSRAHEYLAAQQAQDGSFSIERRTASRSAPVGVTALAALSFMAAGSTPDRGPYRQTVKRAIDWLVERCDDDGYFYFDGDATSKMHGQGYALLALVQAHGMYGGEPSERARLRAKIEAAIALIEATQGVTGGWYYEPRKQPAHENSITVCLVQALRAAKDAGFVVDEQVVRRGESYVRRTQAEDGRFRYGLNEPHKSWELTAAALSTLNAIGDYGSEPVQRGFEALREHDPYLGDSGAVNFRYYGSLYAAQAYWHHTDPRLFERWWPRFVSWCEKNQRPDGSFFNGVFGNVYATAITSLSLQVPLGYLPIFQR